jgi:BTG family
MASSTSLNSISISVSHAIAYVIRPLSAFMSASIVLKLQLALEANLTAHYAQSWDPSDPRRGSGRRCLTFSPRSLPPRPIHASCVAAKVQWSEWMTALGNIEFDLFVDPGQVSLRFIEPTSASKLITVWSDERVDSKSAGTLAVTSLQTQLQPQALARSRPNTVLPTLAQQLLIEDEEGEEELFAALADELREQTWKTPVVKQFPLTIPPKYPSSSPTSHHSRSSSLSSDSSCSWLSFDSDDSDSTSATTVSSVGTGVSRLSRRKHARQVRSVFVDASKKEVTNYDGGKTTVLTGGVMLGARPAAAKSQSAYVASMPKGATVISSNWRSART